MNRSNISPEAGKEYVGTVMDVCRFGLKIKLNGFSKKYEGMLHSSELIGNLSKLIVGNLIRVKIIAVSSDGFISITARNLEQPSNSYNNKISNSLMDEEYMERKRKIRVASPGRNEIRQYTHSGADVKVQLLNEEPAFLRNISNKVTSSRIPQQIKIYRNEYSHMASVAKQRTKNLSFSPFYFTESAFTSCWDKPTKETDLFNLLKMSTSVNPNVSPIDYKKRSQMSIKQQRESLPIFKFREEIIKLVTNNKVLIVIAETGSGKTTQIPQYLIEGGYVMKGKIACTQPRRFAATSVAMRVAQEYGCMVGKDVGYKIRFEDFTSPSTLIKYMTDGILLRECMSDKNLDNYSVIILDEAHERTMYTDVLFGLLKEAVKRRPNLRLVISSATLDAAKFSTFFDGAKVLNIPGSVFPVETLYYRYPTTDYFTLALNTVLNIHMRETDGDILVFLTGQDEIEYACEALEEYTSANRSRFSLNLIVLPMFSALPPDIQSEVLSPTPKGSRKVIIATNIAEASVTIDGIKFVVDSGYAKQKVNDPKTGIDTLAIIPISQSSADQRLGRAGRTAPGKCYRLYPEIAYKEEMLPATIPEIQRADLAQVILHLEVIGIYDILNFDFMDPPQKDNIVMALKQLYLLDALDEHGKITNIGRKMAELPVEPKLAKMLIVSERMKCADEIITIVAMQSAGNVFYRPRKQKELANEKRKTFDHGVGDHFVLLNVFNKWELNYCSEQWCKTHYLNEKKLFEAQDVRKHLLSIMEKYKYDVYSAGHNHERIQVAICSGSFQNVAYRNVSILARQNKSYKTLDGQESYIHPSSCLFQTLPVWVVYSTLRETSKKFLHELTVINPMWLQYLFPRMFKVTTGSPFNDNSTLMLALKQI